MQKITRDTLIEKAQALIADGTVNRVLGWKNGEFFYDVTPAIFESVEDMKKDFVFGDFSGANFSKYLVKETKKDGKVLVFLKPCDTYSFNQLLTEHRFDREKVYAVGIPCDGMVDVNKIKQIIGDGLLSIKSDGDTILVETLYDGVKELKKEEVLSERCSNCKSKRILISSACAFCRYSFLSIRCSKEICLYFSPSVSV